MCVDYTVLNKACPKVSYPLPRIDQVVDTTIGCETLCFLDMYLVYHQITMKEADQLATSFITPFGAYYYVTMSFGLKNAGATYQICMNQCLSKLIEEVVEVYIDNIVVKSRKADQLVSNLEATFNCLREFRIKLNLENAYLGSPRESSSDSSFPSGALKPTQRRSQRSRI